MRKENEKKENESRWSSMGSPDGRRRALFACGGSIDSDLNRSSSRLPPSSSWSGQYDFNSPPALQRGSSSYMRTHTGSNQERSGRTSSTNDNDDSAHKSSTRASRFFSAAFSSVRRTVGITHNWVITPTNRVCFTTVTRALRAWLWMFSKYALIFLASVRFYFGFYHLIRITLDIVGLLAVHLIGRIGLLRPSKTIYKYCFGGPKGRAMVRLHRKLAKASTYEEWFAISEQLDDLTGQREWCESTDITQDNLLCDFSSLRSHVESLRKARMTQNWQEMAFLLRVCCTRNFCHLRNPALYAHSFVRTKCLVEEYYDEVCLSLDVLTASVLATSSEFDERSPINLISEQSRSRRRASSERLTTPAVVQSADDEATSIDSEWFESSPCLSLRELHDLLSALRLSLGRTALCLSGGGGLAVSHMGVIKTLLDMDSLPRVVSGSSGGALIAALLAVMDDISFRREMLVPDFLLSRGAYLSPPYKEQMRNFMKTGYMLDKEEFTRFTRTLIGEMTFADGFAKTGRFVSITTTPAGRRGGAVEPLVCNCINTPDLLIWSAVVASCSLPLILPPSNLFTKPRSYPRSPPSSFRTTQDVLKLDEDGRNLDEDGRNLDEDGRNLDEDGRNLDEDGRNLDEDGRNLDEDGRNLDEEGRNFDKDELEPDKGGPMMDKVRGQKSSRSKKQNNLVLSGRKETVGRGLVHRHTMRSGHERSPTSLPLSANFRGTSKSWRVTIEKAPKNTPLISPNGSRLSSSKELLPVVDGDLSSYTPETMQFVDGSILQDIPHSELQTLFNVKSFIVSQVNPHFSPFIGSPASFRLETRPLARMLDSMWKYFALDLRNRYTSLLSLALVPTIRGQDVSPFLMQAAEGHITILPAAPSDFWRLTANPSVADVARGLIVGERRTWPHVHRIKHVLQVENKLRNLWLQVSRRITQSSPKNQVAVSKSPTLHGAKAPSEAFMASCNLHALQV